MLRIIKLSHFTDLHISLAFIMIFLNKRYYVKSYCISEYDVGDKNVSLFPWCYLVQITTRKLNIKCFHYFLKCLEDSLPFILNYWMFLIFKILYSLQQCKKHTKIPMNYSLTKITAFVCDIYLYLSRYKHINSSIWWINNYYFLIYEIIWSNIFTWNEFMKN